MTDKKDEEIFPVFRLKANNRSNTATIRHVGYVKESEKLLDEVIELDKPIHPQSLVAGKHAIPFDSIGKFDVKGNLSKCNIIGSHLITSNRYPLMYLNISYERPMVSGSLFQIFVSIDMDSDIKKTLTNPNKYIDLTFSGKWVMHIECDEELTNGYEQLIVEMLENEATEEFYSSTNEDIINLRNILSDEQIVEWIDKYVAKQRDYYDNIMKEHYIEFYSMTKLRDYFVELSLTPNFNKFLKIAMKCREAHRLNEYGVTENQEYKIPEKVIRMSDVQNDLIMNNEIVLDDD